MRQEELKKPAAKKRLTPEQKARRRRRRRIRKIKRALFALLIVVLALGACWLGWVLLTSGEPASPAGETAPTVTLEPGSVPAGEAAVAPDQAGSAQPTATPEPVKLVENTEVRVAASMNHSAWIIDGRVRVAGSEGYDQSSVDGWENVLQLSLSDGHIVALTADDTVLAAGQNGNGQCSANGMGAVSYVAAAPMGTVCVMYDGTVRIFGVLDAPIREGLQNATNVKLVDVSSSHAVVLHTDGSVSAYGVNSYEECNVSGWQNVVSVSAGNGFTVALTRDGKVLFTGHNNYNQRNVTQWTDLKAIEAGTSFVIGLRRDGTLLAMGRNGQGQCDLDDWSGVTQVAAGYDHTIGLCENGTVLAAGYNGNGQCSVQ